MEEYVRRVLVRHGDVFENHWIGDDDRGEYLTQMMEAIPGQYDKQHGVDIFAVDFSNNLWVIEVSQADFKGGGRGVKYADGELQMSFQWRRKATFRFLDLNPRAPAMVRDLLWLPATDNERMVKLKFLHRFQKHRKAVILLEGADFNPAETDVKFETEVYTHRSRRR
jgi:hypothetical protein